MSELMSARRVTDPHKPILLDVETALTLTVPVTLCGLPLLSNTAGEHGHAHDYGPQNRDDIS